jgi:hypothetical protein
LTCSAVVDQREAILSRLVAICGGVSGIAAVGRNRLDVTGLVRPAVVVLDGTEAMIAQPETLRRSELQRMELSPGVTLFVRGDDGAEAGALLSRYRSAIVSTVLSDAALGDAVGKTGRIRYQGCEVLPPDAEAKEHQLDLTLVFTYEFKSGDLAS